MKVAERIAKLAAAYSDQTAGNLARMIRIPSPSGLEGDLIPVIADMAHEAGFQEVRVDGLGNLLARIGSGPGVLAIHAHVDTVDTRDLTR